MTVLVYVQGQLDPIQLDEPFQATMTNMSASVTQGLKFFVGRNEQFGPCAIQVDKITHMFETGVGVNG
jgi:hypothetical protein